MTLQAQHTVSAPATLTDEQRNGCRTPLENAQSVNTRRNYAGQLRKFRDWCEHEGQTALPVSPEVVAAYAAELVDDGKSMSTVRLAVAAIVDAHKRVGQESPVNAGVAETLRGLTRQISANQKQARPLDADALAAIRATAFSPRRSRGGSMESESAALKRGRVDVALASMLSDAGLCVSEAAQFRWRDVIDAEDGAGLVHIERSKTDQEGEGAFVAITPETYEALKQQRQDSRVMPDADAPVFGLSMSQISRRVVNMARAAGLGDGYSSHSGRVDLAIRMTRRGLRCRRSRHTGAGSYRQCQPDILGARRWSTTVTLAARGPV